MLTLNLPFPVSVNGMYSNAGKRRIKSPRYRVWRQKALKSLGEYNLGPLIDNPIMLQIALTPPDKRVRDLDNHAKAIQDVLTGNVIVDDAQIKMLMMFWGDEPDAWNRSSRGNARVIITSLYNPLVEEFVSSFEKARAA